jgi:pyrroline-5-carboxylate reductase
MITYTIILVYTVCCRVAHERTTKENRLSNEEQGQGEVSVNSELASHSSTVIVPVVPSQALEVCQRIRKLC